MIGLNMDTIQNSLYPERYPDSDDGDYITKDNTLLFANLFGQDHNWINNKDFGIYEMSLSKEIIRKLEGFNNILKKNHNKEYLSLKDENSTLIFGEYDYKRNWITKKYPINYSIKKYEIKDSYSYDVKQRLSLKNKIREGLLQLADYRNMNKDEAKRISTLKIDTGITYLEKEHGLEIVVGFKNIGNYDIDILNPYRWVDEPKTIIVEYKTYYDCWFALYLGGVYKDGSENTRISLIPKYLNLDKTKLSLNKEAHSFTIPANDTVYVYYFIPNDDIDFYKDINDYESEKYKFDLGLLQNPNYVSASYLQIWVGPFHQYFYWDYDNRKVYVK